MACQVEALKWVAGTNIMVDGFRFVNERCRTYFLTHFHSDHTIGLTRDFSGGLIYCSPVTATLLRKDKGMPAGVIVPLALDVAHQVAGVEVTLIDANHCPGAVLLLFRVPRRPPQAGHQVVLHTGDMRWHDGMASHAALAQHKPDLLYLDTTYANPRYTFPPQAVALNMMVEVMRAADAEHGADVLFVVGAYHIGKERAFLGAARMLGWRIWACPAKRRVLNMLGLTAADLALLTDDPTAARIHVTFMGAALQPPALSALLAEGPWTKCMAFRPTGWAFQRKGGLQVRREGDNITIYGVPYSEHSSFSELRACVAALRPRRIIPTVNADTPAAARGIVDLFADCMDLTRDRSRLDMYLRPSRGLALPPAPAACDSDAAMPLQDSGSTAGWLVKQELEPDTCSDPGRASSAQAIGAQTHTLPGSGAADQLCKASDAVELDCKEAASLSPWPSGSSAASADTCYSAGLGTTPAGSRQCGHSRQVPALEARAGARDAGCSEQTIDLSEVNVAEQARLLAAIQRQYKLQQAVQAANNCRGKGLAEADGVLTCCRQEGLPVAKKQRTIASFFK